MVRRWRLDCGSCVVYIREVGAMLLPGTWYHGNQEQISWTKSLRWFDDECCNLCSLCKTSSTLLLTVALLRLRKTSLPFHSSFNPSRKQLHNKMFWLICCMIIISETTDVTRQYVKGSIRLLLHLYPWRLAYSPSRPLKHWQAWWRRGARIKWHGVLVHETSLDWIPVCWLPWHLHCVLKTVTGYC